MEIDKTYQLNLTWNLKKYIKDIDLSNVKELNPALIDLEYPDHIFNENVFEIKIINMDYYRNLWYSKNIQGENLFLMLLSAETVEEMDMISKGDKIMEKIANKVEKLNELESILEAARLENDEEKLRNTSLKAGLKRGIEQGIEQGEKKASLKIAKNMLIRGFKDIDIEDVTGLSIAEINKLK